MNLSINAICIGQPRPFRGDEPSAFAKQPVSGPVEIGIEGIVGDAQADRVHHGGPHMALHLYPLDHHEFWRSEIGDQELLDQPGGFASNLSVAELNESDVKLGDRFRLGSALIEVSQPRLPCWKIEHRFGQSGMVKTIILTGKSGWYFRVLEPGSAQAGDALERVETDVTHWTIAEIFAEIANPKAKTTFDRIEAMAACELLGPSWRKGAQSLANALR